MLFACWGSFLNVLGHRLISGKNLLDRSHCIYCHTTIAWYDLIPIISYLILKGRCRSCKKNISYLYPIIELITTISLFALFARSEAQYFIGYFIFFSALIVTIRSDLETMLISRFMTLYLVPVGVTLSYCNMLPLSGLTSIASAFGGWAMLSFFAYAFRIITKKDGVGQGDIDLIAFIGAFTGPLGIWASLLIGSITGSIIGGGYLIITKQSKTARIPFGPFLAFGAMLFILFGNLISQIIL